MFGIAAASMLAFVLGIFGVIARILEPFSGESLRDIEDESYY